MNTPALLTALLLAAGSGAPAPAVAGETPPADQVRAAELAFAATMAERDFEAFKAHLAEDAVFFSEAGPDRGKAAVAARWAAYFEGPEAPFSWSPTEVEVLASGDLALSSGPVLAPDGTRFATFTSIWRLEDDGRWRVVFDKGARHCPPPGQ